MSILRYHCPYSSQVRDSYGGIGIAEKVYQRSPVPNEPVMVSRRYRTLNDIVGGQQGVKVEAVSYDGKRSIGMQKDSMDQVLRQYDRFRKSPVAKKFAEKHRAVPSYDGIMVGEIGDGGALGANIVTDDGRQYLMIDKRYIGRMNNRTWDQVFSHEWYHGLGRNAENPRKHYDEHATSTANAELYRELADESAGILAEAYRRNASDEYARARLAA